jgi:hypothetical protein
MPAFGAVPFSATQFGLSSDAGSPANYYSSVFGRGKDTQVLIPVNSPVVLAVGPLVDDSDFRTLREDIADSDGTLVLNLLLASGSAVTRVVIDPLSGSNGWTHKGQGVYSLAVTALQNSVLGSIQVVGSADGVLPFASAVVTVVPVDVYNSMVSGTDNLTAKLTSGYDAAKSAISAAELSAATGDLATRLDVEAVGTAVGNLNPLQSDDARLPATVIAAKADVPSISALPTKAEMDAAIGAIPQTDLTGIATTADVEAVGTAVGSPLQSDDARIPATVIAAKLDVPSVAALPTKAEMDAAIGAIPQTDLTGIATTADVEAVGTAVEAVDGKVDGLSPLRSDDARLPATLIAAKADVPSIAALPTKAEMDAAIGAIPQPDLSNVATTADVEAVGGKVDALNPLQADDARLPATVIAAKLDVPSISGLATEQGITDLGLSVSALPTKAEMDAAIGAIPQPDPVDLTDVAKKADVEAVGTAVGNLNPLQADDARLPATLIAAKADVPSIAALPTKAEMDAAIGAIPQPDLSNVATTADVEAVGTAVGSPLQADDARLPATLIAAKADVDAIPQVDLSDVASKADLEAVRESLDTVLDGLATSEAISQLAQAIAAIPPDFVGLATEATVQALRDAVLAARGEVISGVAEAINRDHGEGSYMSELGTGDHHDYITCVDSNYRALQGVSVRVTIAADDESGRTIAQGFSMDDGRTWFTLQRGVTYRFWQRKEGRVFNNPYEITWGAS